MTRERSDGNGDEGRTKHPVRAAMQPRNTHALNLSRP